MTSTRVTIEGLQQAQQANEKMMAALRPRGTFGRAVVYVTTELHRRAVHHTPWETGGLRAAHRMKVKDLRGEIYIDPAATNPRQGGRRPAEYGFHLHQQGNQPGLRGGVRAFYQYTVEHDGPAIARRGLEMIKGDLP